MQKPKLVLHHYWRSSCSWRVRWALELKGLSYESAPVNILAGEHRAAAYLAQNPAGFLPALSVDGVAYGESLAVIEWLEDSWPTPPLLPQAPLARLHCRQLALCIAAGTQPLQNPSTLKQFLPDDEAARSRHARHVILRGLEVYEDLLRRARSDCAPAAFSCGAVPTLADVCLIPQVYNALRFEVPLASVPLVRGIYERARATEACQRAAPEAHAPA